MLSLNSYIKLMIYYVILKMILSYCQVASVTLLFSDAFVQHCLSNLHQALELPEKSLVHFKHLIPHNSLELSKALR